MWKFAFFFESCFQSENNALNEITWKLILQASGEHLWEHLTAVGPPEASGYKKCLCICSRNLNLDLGLDIFSKLNYILYNDQIKETGKFLHIFMTELT